MPVISNRLGAYNAGLDEAPSVRVSLSLSFLPYSFLPLFALRYLSSGFSFASYSLRRGPSKNRIKPFVRLGNVRKRFPVFFGSIEEKKSQTLID